MAAWVLAKAFGNGVDLRLLVGGVPSGYRWRSVVGVVGLLMLFTLFASWLFLYFVAVNFPHVVDYFNTEDVFVTGERSDYAGSYNLQAFLAVVFVAPVVEELFFRGMLLTRWSLKWGPTVGIIASSALFGLFHVGFFGAFAFGVPAMTKPAVHGRPLPEDQDPACAGVRCRDGGPLPEQPCGRRVQRGCAKGGDRGEDAGRPGLGGVAAGVRWAAQQLGAAQMN